MLRLIKNKKAIAVGSEYLLVFFLVVGMISAMTIYFRRAIQAKIRDARYVTVNIIKDRASSASGNFVGNLYWAYEPYYGNTSSDLSIAGNTTRTLTGVPGQSTGIFVKDYNDATTVQTFSVTAPPKDAI